MTQATVREQVSFGDFELDLRTCELRRNGVVVKLQPQPAKVLSFLVARAGDIVSRQELAEQVWGSDTFVDFEHGLNFAIRQIRTALEDDPSSPRYLETVPRRGYRFIAAVSRNDLGPTLPESRNDKFSLGTRWILAAGLVPLALLAGFLWSRHRSSPVSGKAAIVIGRFANHTGDDVFDNTLRQGLLIQLEQSPFLKVISDEQIQDTLRLMQRPANSELSPEVAHEVCKRANAAVALGGSIDLIGNRYVLGLNAVNCINGDLVASIEAQASGKNQVLEGLSRLASNMRGKLGESLSSVGQYNVPLASATTPSLEALQSYTQGVLVLSQNFDYTESLAWFEKAVELDPKFALAYWAIGDVYAIRGETSAAIKFTRKAFELRATVSERERALIEANYYYYVLGDVVKARRSCEFFAKVYPDDEDAHTSLAAFAETVGQYDTGLAEYQEALRLAPRRSFLYRDVAYTNLVLDRPEEASSVVQRAHAMGLDENLTAVLYSLAFYRDDRSEMSRQVASAKGKPDVDDLLLAMDADSAAYRGQLEKARTLSERAIEITERAKKRETSSLYYAAAGVREALLGDVRRAKQLATIARKFSDNRDAAYGAAMALAYSGDVKRADELTHEIARKYPEDSIVKCNYLPTLQAKLAIMRSHPQQAIDLLGSIGSCEYGLPVYSYYNWPNLYPTHVRGEAYLAAQRGSEAAAEFQKLLNHRGLVLNEPIGALANLQLGRAYVLSGDIAKARAAYLKFFDLWKEADPDVRLLQSARREFSRLE